MRVNLCGHDALMSQHCLNGAEVCPALQEVCGKGVAQGVGADGFGDACEGGILAQVVEHRNARKTAAPPLADKHEILLARLGRDGGAVDKPQPQLFGGAGRHGHKPFLAPLAHNPQESFFEKQIGHFQVAQLAYAQPAAVKHLNHGTVALAERLRKVNGRDYGVHLFEGKHLGQVDALLWRLEQRGGVGFNVAVHQQEAVERAHARKHAADGARRDADFVEREREAVEVVEFRAKRVDALVGEKREVGLYVVQVCGAGIFRQSLLQHQVKPIFFYVVLHIRMQKY